jgi:hypothetical protein
MLVVPREFAEHALQVYPEVRRIKESMCRLSESKRKAIDIEVNRETPRGQIHPGNQAVHFSG